ncbi:MAG: four helix bundle protein [Crocinitomicaceae bacterium]|nr:four helix bundle protein [Crocinitomicaceae bacterium]
MFDFEKLIVYTKAKEFNSKIRKFIKEGSLDRTTNYQLRRASFSIVLNIAESTGRFTNPDKRNFFVVSRSSLIECVSILDVLHDEKEISEVEFRKFYNEADELSRILFAMIKNLSKK